jgi:hypothetical protein
MTIEQSLIEAVRSLPPEKQRELLEHARRLLSNQTTKSLWAGLEVSISVEDREEVRREVVVRSGGGSFGERSQRRSDLRAGRVPRGSGALHREETPVSQRT